MIKESWTHPTKSGSLRYYLPLMIISDDYFYPKNPRYQLVLSSDIADQRIVQSDWLRDTTDHNQPKVVVSAATFP